MKSSKPSRKFLKNKTRVKRVLITAGPTREWMDPVRFLSNPSTGSMGLAIAAALRKKGHRVTLVMGPTPLVLPENIRVVPVQTAVQMFSAVRREFPSSDAFISTAAVGDWRFKRVSPSKIKKNGAGSMRVTLIKNPDILAWAGTKKANKILVGFALESDREKENARKKLTQKNLDLIIGNRPDSFSNERIKPVWIDREMSKDYSRMKKTKLAALMAAWLERKWNAKT